LKAEIEAEAEVDLLGNGTQTPVPVATNINKDIPVTTDNNTAAILGGGDFSTVRVRL
jgi:hypothetical protein